MWSKGGYSEYDFIRMKQDAIRRAQEMSRRAIGSSSSAQNSGWQTQNTDREENQSSETRCPRCGRIIRNGKHVYESRPRSGSNTSEHQVGDRSNPSRGGWTSPPPPPKRDDESPTKISIPMLGDIEIDRDFLIVGGLLLVLLAEDGDRLLMLALLYIML